MDIWIGDQSPQETRFSGSKITVEASTLAQMLLHHAQTKPAPPSERSELPIPKALEALARIRCEPWTTSQAEQWWQVHAPDSIGLQPM